MATEGASRLDVELVRRGLARSRGQARELVDHGLVTVGGSTASKASTPVGPTTQIELVVDPDPWVGRAAYKLLEALRVFGEGTGGLEVRGRRCLDVGASTGGFTQVLLEAGAANVTALDVGHDQLAARVAADPRVREVSGTSIRDVADGSLGQPFDIVVADLSFISLRLVLPPMVGLLAEGGDLVVLVKPQFEVGRERLARTGVVTSADEQARVVADVIDVARGLGLAVQGLTPSPIRGAEGNREYLLWVSARAPVVAVRDLAALVHEVTHGKGHG